MRPGNSFAKMLDLEQLPEQPLRHFLAQRDHRVRRRREFEVSTNQQ